MTARTDTYTHPDIGAILAAQASVSASGSVYKGRHAFHLVLETAEFLFYLAEQGRSPLPLCILLPARDLDPDLAWMDQTFSALESRLSAPPDQDLLEAAEKLALRLGSIDHADISEEWIEKIADSWSRLRD